jgi:single-strand DNA-binding protein
MLQEDTEFHNCVAWRGLADIAEQYMHKWKKVYVEWYLKTRNWEDTAWVKRYKTEIVADNVILLSASGASEWSYSASSASMDSAPPEEPRVKTSRPKVEEEISIEDIPF